VPRTVTGQRRLNAAHRPTEDARQRRAQLAERFTELGPTALRFWEGLLETQRYALDQAQRVLTLLASYTRSDGTAALERAVRYGAYSHAAVERILAAQARPKSTLETLAEDERRHLPPWADTDPVRPRPTSAYQHLGAEEPHDHAEANPTRDDADSATDAHFDGPAPEGPR
jgi:hypothetical protein